MSKLQLILPLLVLPGSLGGSAGKTLPASGPAAPSEVGEAEAGLAWPGGFRPGPARSPGRTPAPPTLPPPLPSLPPPPPGEVPTRYYQARVGMKTDHRIYPHRGPTARQTTEVLAVDAETVQVRQTVQAGARPYAYDLRMQRSLPLERARAEARALGNPTGVTLVQAGGYRLVCVVYEHRGDGNVLYRTLYCPDVFDGTVRHEDNAAGTWKTRMELVEFTP